MKTLRASLPADDDVQTFFYLNGCHHLAQSVPHPRTSALPDCAGTKPSAEQESQVIFACHI